MLTALKLSFLCLFVFSLLSCNSPSQNLKTNQSVEHEVHKTKSLHCYRYINNKDTIILKTVNVNGFITGILIYNFYEKDKNKGTIQGEIKDNILIANYSFNSEGTASVRQVAFKKSGATFIEGYGDMEEKNGKTIFKNTDSLNFTNSITLTEYNCQQ